MEKKKSRGKFTPEQREFLLSKVAEFREAQQTTSTRAFLPVVYLEWFTKWPTADEGTEADTEVYGLDDLSDDAVLTPRQEMMKVSIYPPP